MNELYYFQMLHSPYLSGLGIRSGSGPAGCSLDSTADAAGPFTDAAGPVADAAGLFADAADAFADPNVDASTSKSAEGG